MVGGSTPNAASDWVGSVQINQNSYGGFQKDLQRIILARVTKVWGEDGKVRGSDPCKEKKKYYQENLQDLMHPLEASKQKG